MYAVDLAIAVRESQWIWLEPLSWLGLINRRDGIVLPPNLISVGRFRFSELTLAAPLLENGEACLSELISHAMASLLFPAKKTFIL